MNQYFTSIVTYKSNRMFGWNNVMIVPSNGAITFPFAGSIAIPLPKAPPAKAASFTSDNGFTFPSIGETITSFDTLLDSLFLQSQASCLLIYLSRRKMSIQNQ